MEAALDDPPVFESMDGRSAAAAAAAAKSTPFSPFDCEPDLLLLLFDPESCWTKILECSVRTAVSPSRPGEPQCSRRLDRFSAA